MVKSMCDNVLFEKCLKAIDILLRNKKNHISVVTLAKKMRTDRSEAWHILYYLAKAGAVKIIGTRKFNVLIILRRGFKYTVFARKLRKILEKEMESEEASVPIARPLGI